MADEILGISAHLDISDVRRSVDELSKDLSRIGSRAAETSKAMNGAAKSIDMSHLRNEAEQSSESIEKMFSKLKNAAAASIAGYSVQQIVSVIGAVRGKYQQYQMALETMLGSTEKASEKMQEFAKLAAITPFGMDDVVSGAKQLMAYGIEADKVTDTMRRLGDVAAGLGLNLNDLAWLYGTTATQGRLFTQDFRQFTGRGIPLAEELAKQFGVTKDKVQELVTAGKVGFPEVEKAIIAMTDEGGKFGGLMENQSKSITGRISNIEDTIEQAVNELGKQTEGIMYTTLDGVTYIVEHWQEVGAAILAAAEAIGIYKAATVGIAAFQSSAANIGYDAEIAQYASIIPQREAMANADLQEAVAEGKLTEAKAAKVAAMREEAAAYVQELEQKAASAAAAAKEAQAELSAATSKAAQSSLSLEEADEKVEAAQSAYEAILELGDADAIATAEENLNSAAVERNIAARNLQTARTEVNVAAKRADAASQAAATAQTELNTAQTTINTAATTRDTVAKGLWAQVTQLCTRAQEALNASFLASPLFWLAAAIAGATFAIYKIITAETAEEAAVRKTNEAWDAYNQRVQDKKDKIQSLIATIKDESATELEQAEAYRQLSDLAPTLTEKYSQQQIAAQDLAEAQKEMNKELDADKIETARKAVEDLEAEYARLEKTAAANTMYGSSTIGSAGYSSSGALAETSARIEEAKQRYADLLALQQQVEDNARPIEVRVKEAQDNEAVTQRIFDFYDKAMVLASDWQEANDTIDYATGTTRLEAFIDKARAELDSLHKDVEANPLDLNLQMEEREKAKILSDLLSWKANAERSGDTTVPLTFSSNYQAVLAQLDVIKKKAASLAAEAKTDATTYAEAYNAARKDYDAKNKRLAAIKANKGSYTQSDYEKAAEELKAAEDAYRKLGGSTTTASRKTSTGTRGASDAARRREQQAAEEQRWQEEMARQRIEAENAAAELEIAQTRSAAERKRKESELQHAKDLQQLDTQEAEFRKATYEHNKKLWEASGKNAGKSYSATAQGKAGWQGVSLTADQQKQIGAQREKIEQEYAKRTEEIEREAVRGELEAMQSYIKEYGTYQQKKLAIAEEYARKIAEAEQGDGTEAEKAWRVKSLGKERDAALRGAEVAAIKQQVDWGSVFGDFGTMFKEQLQPTIDSLRKIAKSDDFKGSSLEDQRTLYELIAKLEQSNTVWDGGILTELASGLADYQQAMSGYNDALEREKEATEQLAAAQSSLKAAQEGGDAHAIDAAAVAAGALQEALNAASADVQGFGGKVEEASARVQSLAQRATSQFQQLESGIAGLSSGTLKGAGEAALKLDSLFGGGLQKAAGSVISKGVQSLLGKDSAAAKSVASALGNSGLAGQIVSAVLGMLDTLAEQGIGGIVSSLADTVLGAVDGIVKNIISGNIATQVGTTLLNQASSILDTVTFGGFSSWIGNGSSDKSLNKDIERLTASNEALMNSIDKLADRMDDATSVGEITDTYEQQVANIEQSLRNTQEMMYRSAVAYSNGTLGIGGKSNSASKLAEAAKEQYGSKSGFLRQVSDAAGTVVESFRGIFQLTAEQMSNLATNAPEIYAFIKEHADDGYKDASQFMDQYISYWEQLDEVADAYREKLTNISFDSVKSDFQSLLEDMDSSTDDFADNVEEALRNAVVNAMMTETYNASLKAWYKKFSDAMESDGELTKAEASSLRDEYNQIVSGALADRDALLKTLGISTTPSQNEQSATAKAIEAITEDQADTLTGIGYAMQIALEQGNATRLLIQTDVSAMRAITDVISMNISEIRDIQYQSLSNLQAIAKNTTPIAVINETMGSMYRLMKEKY